MKRRMSAHSTALHGSIPRARHLPCRSPGPLQSELRQAAPLAQQAAKEAGLSEICRNPFQSIIVRSVETLQAVDEALRSLKHYPEPDRPAAEVRPKAGRGYGCSEAPRGILYHRYDVDDAGLISRGAHRAADGAESADNRRRPAPLRAAPDGPPPQRVDLAVRAGHPQLRSVHLLFHTLPAPAD